MTSTHSTSTELLPHTISWQEFDLLARAAGGPEGVQRLRTAERSRRLLLLRGFIDVATTDPVLHEPLPSPEVAWDLLVRVQETAPAALDTLLVHPYTGRWAGLTTRLLHRRDVDPRPAWVLLGHVHSVAAAAAVRAGLSSFRISVPVWNGDVALPTLGVAHVGGTGEFDTAEVRSADGVTEVIGSAGTVRLPGDPGVDGPGWLGVRTFELAAEHKRLTVRLDDVDPYRGLFRPLPPERLDAEDLGVWRAMLTDAWRLIVTHVPEFADALPAGLDSIVPEPPFPFRLPSASSGESFGSVVICRPDDPAALAATLVHEFQHIRLGGLLQLVRLHSDDRRERIYAPWRDDPRPLGGVIHGIYAFFGVAAFYRALTAAHPDDELAAFEFAHWRDQVWRTLETIIGDEALTEAGHRFLGLVSESVRPWLTDPVAEGPARWSALLAAEHYAGWRIRHLRPHPDFVSELAEAWLCGLSRPKGDYPEPVLVTAPDGEWSEARADLVRVRLGNDGERRARDVWPRVPGLREPDFALIDGRDADALTAYRADLLQDPDDPGTLVGLGLGLRMTGKEQVAEELLGRPELVRALHRVLRERSSQPLSPEDVARWLGA